MAFEQSIKTISLESGADLTAKQYHFVQINTSTGKVEACAAGGDGIGILQNAPAAGEAASVAIEGVSKLLIETAASVGFGSNLMADAAGGGELATSTNYVLAKCLEDPTTDDEVVAVLLHKIGPA
jgi:hypothetical protein